MSLRETRAKELDKYIEEHLLPDTTFKREVRSAIDTISSFLKNRCFRDTGKSVRVTKVVKGGSSGKGTALKGCSDADLVVFLSNLKSYQDQIDRRKELIEEIKKQLKECKHEQECKLQVKFEVNEWPNPRVLSFRMKSTKIGQWVEFDVLPAFDVLGHVIDHFKPDESIYIDLIRESKDGGEFSTCFTELQKNFLRQRCTKLKSLIRLVKHWYKMCREKMESLPPQYALELLTVYAWEHGSKKTDFSTAQGFQTVLYLIQKYQELMVYWTIYYDIHNETIAGHLCRKLQEHRPVILDPADPTGDVGGGCKWKWDKLAQEAQNWSSALCFQNGDGSHVEPWKVPFQMSYAQTCAGCSLTISDVATMLLFVPELDWGPKVTRWPVILDPADPTGDVGGGRQWRWDRLAEEAKAWSYAQCFRNLDGSWVEPWDVPNHGHLKLECGGLLLTSAECPSWALTIKGHRETGTSHDLGDIEEFKALMSLTLSVQAVDTMDLWNTRPGDLDRYIEVHLLPDTPFKREVRRAIDAISSFLKDRCFRDTGKSVRVTKVVKGGSSGKGTALRGRSDADLVVFLSNLKSYRDQKDRRKECIEAIKKQLVEWERDQTGVFAVKFEENRWPNPRVLSFQMRLTMYSPWVDFDLLPAFDALGQLNRFFKPDPQVYIELIRQSQEGEEGEFSTCFTELQRNFLKERCTKLKSLIRLVKHWYKMCEEKLGSLPPKYALELLTVYAWEHGSKETYFRTAEGFRTVLHLIEQYQDLQVYWTVNYDFHNETIGSYLRQQLQKPRPVILDPADPTCDVGGNEKYRHHWEKLAQEAQQWSHAPCFQNGNITLVQPWDVPVEQTLKGSKGFPSNPEVFYQSGGGLPKCNYYFQSEPATQEETRKGSKGFPGNPEVFYQSGGGLPKCNYYFQSEPATQEETRKGSKGFPVPSYSGEVLSEYNHYSHVKPLAQQEPTCTVLWRVSASLQSARRTASSLRPAAREATASLAALQAVTAAMALSQTAARALDKFVQDNLTPQKDFLDQVRQAVNTICKVLREKCFQNSTPRIRVMKVIKGGSYGRGTALRGASDADLIVFLSCFKAYADQGAWQPESFTEIRTQLEACWQKHPQGLSLQFSAQKDPRALRFRLESETLHSCMDVSLKPAFDALGHLGPDTKPSPQVYADLINCGSPAGTYTACFTELRKNFVNIRPCKLKHLILLVKHWYLLVTEVHQEKLQSAKSSLPPIYALELLTIYAWEKGCGKEKFSIAEGFRTVLGLIQKYQELCIHWEVNYSTADEAVGVFLQSQFKKPRPVILDPADPTWDVAHRDGRCWELLAQEAKSCLSYPCFVQGDGSPVQPWGALGLLDPGADTKGEDPVGKEKGMPRRDDGRANTIPECPGSSGREAPKGKPGPGRTNDVNHGRTDMDLYHIPARELDKFIRDVLQPDSGFQEQMGKVTETIFRCLREKCFRASSPTIRVLRASKGGSYGRGTALRGASDADLIVFLSCFKAYADQGAWQPESFTEIRTQLEACWQKHPQGLSLQFSAQEDPRALRFRLESETLHSCMDVSLKPAFDALGPLPTGSKPRPQVYADLLRNGSPPGTYSECFTELQRDFVNIRPAKLKSLILLVKHWYQQVSSGYKAGQQDDECLPPAYALELLTIYAWEQAGRKDKFHMAEGFLTVLGLIRDYQQLCIYWTVNYDFDDKDIRSCLQKELRKPRPLILDPADPTWNVGQGSWEMLAREAENCGRQTCFVNGDRSPVQPWDVMPALLQQTPSWDLDNFISKFLQPNREFLGQVNRAVDIICSFLKENCFRNSSTKVLKVVKGGSSAKGTALKGRSDADLVVFLSCFSRFADQGMNRAEIITEIRTQLEACRQEMQFDVKFEISKWENPRVLSFTLTSETLDHSVNFDVLPAFNALGQLGSGTKPKLQVYVDLIDSYNNGGEFSSCFTELQRDFVISRPAKLKNLIRLVKHWYKQCISIPKGRGALPPQYALELLTIYAWEQGDGTAHFNMAEGFRTVLELVQNYKNLCIHWKVNYHPENEIIKNFLIQQLRKPRPIILDPADPTGNLGHGTRWDLLAKEAASYAKSVCCANKSGDFVQPWALKVRKI
ncbi:2'-5'-oligoadenylate synthase 3-like [Dromiciops gliroides]|uniref:2'-5'-oligoadenylate synthase 3-like n=1 Tax=Dromiciops gliroides TaxID=33562 RepID=UPI001CC7B46C|nr:2'-5'-oligoadenylate synthase 3-like [Dromiciops gliroides]